MPALALLAGPTSKGVMSTKESPKARAGAALPQTLPRKRGRAGGASLSTSRQQGPEPHSSTEPRGRG